MAKKEEKNISVFKEVQAAAEELRNLAEDEDEIEVDCCNVDLLPPPKFNTSLALNFVQHAMDEMIMCNVVKAKTSKEARKILKKEICARGSHMQ